MSKLTPIRFHHKNTSSKGYWLYKCSCGVEKVIRKDNVDSGSVVSCGCYSKNLDRPWNKKHNMTGSQEYRTWASMKTRCLNKNEKCYKDYGGRGITVCKRWLKFENFYADMGIRPEGMTLDRIDNNKGYSKENCRWATVEDQAYNKRTTIYITVNGARVSFGDLSKLFSIEKHRLWLRLFRYKWPLRKALLQR